MALLINFLDALGALLLLGIAYQELPVIAPGSTFFASFIALLFVMLSYVLRRVAYEQISPDKTMATIGLVLVSGLLLVAGYFYVPLWLEVESTFQIVSMLWLPVIALFILGESVLSLRRHF